MPRSHGGRSLIALAITVWSQACVSQRPVPANLPPVHGARLRVRSTQPFLLSESDGDHLTAPICHASAVSGSLRKVMSDTLVLERVGGVVNAPDTDAVRRGCLTRDVVGFVRTPEMEITERTTDKGKTTLLLVGIAAALIGFAAYAASQIEYSWPTGTGTFLRAANQVHP